MKTIGLIGGMSWESSSEYYRIINNTIKERLGGLHSAKCVMYSADFEEIENVISKPIHKEVQTNGRIRHWAFIQELGKYLQVVTEPDGETVHNAFLDRRFKP